MNDTYITLVGNVSAEPRQYDCSDGSRATSLRLASTRRVFDRASQTWHDGETTFYAVRCYRTLAENVARSVRLGQPIVVYGKLRIRSYERDGQRRTSAEVEATSVGHDLRRGVSTFQRPQRGPSSPALDQAAHEHLVAAPHTRFPAAADGHLTALPGGPPTAAPGDRAPAPVADAPFAIPFAEPAVASEWDPTLPAAQAPPPDWDPAEPSAMAEPFPEAEVATAAERAPLSPAETGAPQWVAPFATDPVAA
ncbi:single-stranded DNA-binding protein [Sphaerisporangium melleum]|nr:single-stranded DNA-binding protein [Sphaerisporangium melleum]